MPVHSFSTRKLDRQNEEMIQDMKEYCIAQGINFSHMVIEAIAMHPLSVKFKRGRDARQQRPKA